MTVNGWCTSPGLRIGISLLVADLGDGPVMPELSVNHTLELSVPAFVASQTAPYQKIQHPVQQKVFSRKQLHSVFAGLVNRISVDESMRLFSSGGEPLGLSSARSNNIDSGCRQIAGTTEAVS